jgi:hypothetical protein
MPTPAKGYWLNGKRVPSVSTILGSLGWGSDALLNWAVGITRGGGDHNAVRQEAADIGTASHDMIECHLCKTQFDPFTYPDHIINQARPPFQAFKDWAADKTIRVINTEISLVSSALRYGGTVDCLAEVDGVTTLLDWKTSNWLYPKNILQAIAYQDLIAECLGVFVEQTIIVQITKSGECKTLTVDGEAITQARTAFYHLLELHKLQKPLDALTRSVNTPGEPRPSKSVLTLMGIPLNQAVLA